MLSSHSHFANIVMNRDIRERVFAGVMNRDNSSIASHRYREVIYEKSYCVSDCIKKIASQIANFETLPCPNSYSPQPKSRPGAVKDVHTS